MLENKTVINFTLFSKKEKYHYAVTAIEGLCAGEQNTIANMANIAAVLKQVFDWWWIGFYLVHIKELVLGPFQGPVACTRILKGQGVCGQCWETEKTIIVADVHQFLGHIACSAESNSEIVVPVFHQGAIVAVLDADSIHFSDFDAEDLNGLESICAILAKTLA